MGSRQSISKPTEFLDFPNTCIASNGSVVYKYNLQSDGKKQRNLLGHERFSPGMYQWLSMVQTETTTCIIVISCSHSLYYFSYYNLEFNLIKNISWQHINPPLIGTTSRRRDTITDVQFIDEERFLCRMNKTWLAIANINNTYDPMKICFYNTDQEWWFKPDNKNIIILHDISYIPVGMNFKIRTLTSASNYDDITDQSFCFYSNTKLPFNLLYLYNMPTDISFWYQWKNSKIIDICQKNNVYYVLFEEPMSDHIIVVDKWEHVDEWKRVEVLKACGMHEYHKINSLINKSVMNSGGNQHYINCIVPEKKEDWNLKTCNLLKNMKCLNRFSSDLILLLVDYIA